LIFLNENLGHAMIGKIGVLVGFHKETPPIGENRRLNQNNVWDL
jgi:hypothetical protein